MVKLTYPFDESAVRALRAGDAVSVNGLVRTGRDRFHKHFADGGKLPCDFRDGASISRTAGNCRAISATARFSTAGRWW